jgi:hypothetical protein
MTESNEGQTAKQQRYHRLKEAGLCVECGKVPPLQGILKCEVCNQRYLKSAKKAADKRYAKQRAAGMCSANCGRPARPGKTRCAACAKKGNKLIRRRDQNRRANNKEQGLCTECGGQLEVGFVKCEQCRKRYNKLRKIRDKTIKDAAFAAYGGYVCSCCGETHEEFLQIDHVNNDGAKHRRDDPTAYRIYFWLRKYNYPPGFRVLCSNCNWAYARYGYCPHQDGEVQRDVKDTPNGAASPCGCTAP